MILLMSMEKLKMPQNYGKKVSGNIINAHGQLVFEIEEKLKIWDIEY